MNTVAFTAPKTDMIQFHPQYAIPDAIIPKNNKFPSTVQFPSFEILGVTSKAKIVGIADNTP